jgi:hypothetical protein
MGLATYPQDTPRGTGQTGTAVPSTLRVEVLGDARVQGERCYRVEGQSGLHNLAEVRRFLLQHQKSDPSVQKLAIVVYKNSPDTNRPQVSELVKLAGDLNLTPSVESPDSRAP